MMWPLVLAGFALGVAATPHCAGMCGAPCAALTQACGRSVSGFHLGRLIGYMAAGAVAMSFDRHLRADAHPERFSRVV